MRHKRWYAAALGSLIGLLASSLCALGQMAPESYGLKGESNDVPPSGRLASNVIIDIRADSSDQTVWLGTGQGVSRFLAPNGWESFGEAQGLGKGGTSALVWTDSIIWAAFAFDTTVGISGAGGGLAYSRDGGDNWTWVPQPRDSHVAVNAQGYSEELGYWPTTTNVDNITYDIALSDSFVWITSKGGGLRRHRRLAADYTDYYHWEVVTPDTLPFHPAGNLNHIAFAVVYAEGVLWVGTADGINKSTDEGRTWTNYDYFSSGISGNFVTALAWQDWSHTLWAATWRAEGASEYYGVTKTTDKGATWEVVLDDEKAYEAEGIVATVRAHNFAFDDSAVYVCDDAGLWRSADGGTRWNLFPLKNYVGEGEENWKRFYDPTIYSALAYNGLWVGGVEGLALSMDMGNTWHLFQTALPLSDPARSADTYAYPNPFSPTRFPVVRFRYQNPSAGEVSVTIFDFSMTKVTDAGPPAFRPGGELYEVWDGKKNGTIVANGTYFYRIKKPGSEVWGKVVILD